MSFLRPELQLPQLLSVRAEVHPGVGRAEVPAGAAFEVVAGGGPVIHHPPARPRHPQTEVHVLEILAVAFVETADGQSRLAADHQEAAGKPLAGEGLVRRVLGVEVALQRAAHRPAQPAPPRGTSGSVWNRRAA